MIWLNAEEMPALLGVKQRQAEHDQQSGDAGGEMHLFGLRGAGGNAVAAHQRLVETEIEAEQILAEDGQAEHHQGKADQPRQRADGPEGETEQSDGGGDDTAGGGGGHGSEAGEALGQARHGELPDEENEAADQGDDKGRTARDQQ